MTARRLMTALAMTALVSGSSQVAEAQGGATYRVTVTNLTKGQRFTPILAATHTADARIFATGTSASAELRAVAEEGNVMPLMTALQGLPAQVFEVTATDGLLTPAVTTQFEIQGRGNFTQFSMVAMLIPTNDAFVGLSSVTLPMGFDPMVVDAVAYDAGTERNDELCASIPGPDFAECGGPGGGAQVGGGEGAVTVHNGIHGVGTMNEALRDWRNPVARVTIQRVR